jgi:predicted nucleic acid-binding protein
VWNLTPCALLAFWREGWFDLLTSADQLGETMRVTRYPKIRGRPAPALAGRLINEIRDLAIVLRDLPTVTTSADPTDDRDRSGFSPAAQAQAVTT